MVEDGVVVDMAVDGEADGEEDGIVVSAIILCPGK